MDLLEIMSNFWAALAILAVVAIGYGLFVWRHPYSEDARDAIHSSLLGCVSDAGVWFGLLFIAIVLGTRSLQVQWVFEQVLGTKILNVTLITWSMIFVPLVFAVHKACGRFDYRPLVIGTLLAIALICALYYWLFVPYVPTLY